MTAKRPIKVNTCEVCGCEFVGLRHYLTYRACKKPECKTEVRRRAWRAWQETRKKEKASETVNEPKAKKKPCLKCGKFIPGPNRLCSSCRHSNREHYAFADAWM